MEIQALLDGIISGDRLALSRAITLAESQLPEHRAMTLHLVSALPTSQKKSIRLGITGIPGVGKSTFIETLGSHITASGLQLAVLAIDPSSSRSRGSILGDKTRMEKLSRDPSAFIRPSPSGGALGGVALRTREAMLLCEAAGFDVIFIETVGVGQSETALLDICDTFLLLAMPGTGDELQGIKRGIMEAADIIVINKADGDYELAAKKAKKQLEMALHLFPAAESGWMPRVLLASALYDRGTHECWKLIQEHHQHQIDSGWLDNNRREQQRRAFRALSEFSIYEHVMRTHGATAVLTQLDNQVRSGGLNEYSATLKLLNDLFSS